LALITGCGSAQKKESLSLTPATTIAVSAAPKATPTDIPGPGPVPSRTPAELQAEVDSLKMMLAEAKQTIDQLMNVKKPTLAAPAPSASQSRGGAVEARQDSNDPESGFVSDSAVQSYRQAMILYQTQKYPEAVLAFSAFLERYGDHPLAGSAQFYSGEAYFKQKEHKLAWQEYLRVVSAYDRSPQISHALARLAQIAQTQGLKKEATDYRQTLTSLFPASPAIAWLVSGATQGPGSAAVDLPPEKVSAPADSPPTAPLPGEGAQ